MDIEYAKFLLQLLEFLIVGACSVYVYIANKNRVTNERIDAMEAGLEVKIDGHGERIAHLEAHAEQAVTHDDLGSIHQRINQVGDDVSALGGKFSGFQHLLTTIHEHLLRAKE